MDTSEQYIKMCEKAREIQKPWKPEAGDWVYYYDGHFCNVHHITSWMLTPAPDENLGAMLAHERACYHEVMAQTRHWMKRKGNKFDLLTGVYVWLPRQDQLQEMLNLHHYTSLEKCWDFAQSTNGWMFDSMEQLWLAFVMKEKYNKVWNSEEWQVSPE